MRWLVVGARDDARRMADIAALIGAEEVAYTDETLLPVDDTRAIALVGSDHDLARLAVAASSPIALVPGRTSDMARMFALRGVDHLITGAPYPADLGVVELAGAEHPFVAHAVLSTRGRLPGLLARRRNVTIVDDRDRLSSVDGSAVVVANAQHVRGNTIAPRSALMDGVADLQVLGHRGRVSRRLLKRGLHLQGGATWRRRIAAARIDVPPSWKVTTDGVVVGRGPCTIRIEPARFTLWI